MDELPNLPEQKIGSVGKSAKRGLAVGFMVFILVMAGFVSGIVIGNRYADNKSASSRSQIAARVENNLEIPDYLKKEIDFNLFWKVWDLTKNNYVDQPVLDAKIFYGALKGMVDSLEDPHSVFLTPDEAKDFSSDLEGSFEGIGAEIGKRNGQLMIISPLDQMPAQKAGLQPGDYILKINGEDTTNISVVSAVSKIRGEKGTEVVLTIYREGDNEAKEIAVTRGIISVKPIQWEFKEGNILYIKARMFNQETNSQLNKAAVEAMTSGPKGIVLDLRNNPGGFLGEAVEMASKWIDDGPIVKEADSQGNEQSFGPVGQPFFKDINTVVLINRGSASASEIVAGALKDYAKAIIVGEQSYGKGSVQQLENLNDGSALKITFAKWLTPSGTSIEDSGIKPDIEIENTQDDWDSGRDPQLEKALELLRK